MRLVLHGHDMVHGSRPDQAANLLTKNAMVRSLVNYVVHKSEVAGDAKRRHVNRLICL